MVKLCIVLIFSTVAQIASAQSQNTTFPTSCGLFKCGTTGKTVWSIVNGKCRHWPNQCQFDNENCNRQNQSKKALVATTREKCIKRCRKYCTKIYRPVCVSFLTDDQGPNNIKKVTFSNRCLFKNHVCLSGRSLGDRTKEGVCDEGLNNNNNDN